MLLVTQPCTVLLCLMFTWPTSQYPIPTKSTTKLKTAEDCLEVDLQKVEELRSQTLDELAHSAIIDNFGLMEDDWKKLKALEDLLPSNSPLKNKLYHTFRILLAAIKMVHENQNITDDRGKPIYRQADESIYPLSSGNRSIENLNSTYYKVQSGMETDKGNTTLTEDVSSTEASSFIKLNNMYTAHFSDSLKFSASNHLPMSNTGISLFNMSTENTVKSTGDERSATLKPTEFKSMNSGGSNRSSTTKDPSDFTHTVSKSDFKITVTDKENNRLEIPLIFGYNDSTIPENTFATKTENKMKTVSTDTTKEQFTEYVTTETSNPTTLFEALYKTNSLNTKSEQTNLRKEIITHQDMLEHTLNLPPKTDKTGSSEHVTVSSNANDFIGNVSTNIYTMKENIKYKTTPVLAKLEKNISNHEIITAIYLTLPVTNSPLITLGNISVTPVNDKMGGVDNWLINTATLTTMAPDTINEQDHTSSEGSITVLEELKNSNHNEEIETLYNYRNTVTVPTENGTRSVPLLESDQKGSVVANTEVNNNAGYIRQTWPVSTSINDYTLRDSTENTDEVVTETGLYFTESLHTSDKQIPGRSKVSKVPNGSKLTQNEITSFTTNMMTDRILTTTDKLITKLSESTVEEIDTYATAEASSDTEEIKITTDFNTNSIFETSVLSNREITTEKHGLFGLTQISNEPLGKDSTLGKDETKLHGSIESQIVDATTLYDTSSTVNDTEPFVSEAISTVAAGNTGSNHSILVTEYSMTTSRAIVSQSSQVEQEHIGEAEYSTDNNIMSSLTETQTVPYSFQNTVGSTIMYNPESSSSSSLVYNIFENRQEKSTNSEYMTVTYSKPNDVSHVVEDGGSTLIPITTSYIPYVNTTTETQGDFADYGGARYNVSSVVTDEANRVTVTTSQVNTENEILQDITERTKVQTVTDSYNEIVKLITGSVTASLTSNQEDGLVMKDSIQSTTPSSDAIYTYTVDNILSQNTLLNNIIRLNISEETVVPDVHSVTRKAGEGSGAQSTIARENETTTESIFIPNFIETTKLDVSETTTRYTAETESDIMTKTETQSVTMLPSELHNTVSTTPPASDTTVIGNTSTLTNPGYTVSNNSLFEPYSTELVTPYYVKDMSTYSKVPPIYGFGEAVTSNNKHVSSSPIATVIQSSELDCKDAHSDTPCDPHTTEKTPTVPMFVQDLSSTTQPATTVDFTRKNIKGGSKINRFFIKLPQMIKWSDSKPMDISNMSSLPAGILVKPDAYSLIQKCISSSPCLKVQHNEFIPRNVRPDKNNMNYSFSSDSQQELQSNRNELMWWYKMRKLKKKPHSEYNF